MYGCENIPRRGGDRVRCTKNDPVRGLSTAISRARDSSEPVTDDAARLKAQWENTTGERISPLKGIEQTVLRSGKEAARAPGHGTELGREPAADGESAAEKSMDPPPPGREKPIEMRLEL